VLARNDATWICLPCQSAANGDSRENVSQTGLLFRAAKALAENAEVEMILEMPREIVGQEHAQVIARGMVVRSVPPENGEGHPATAAGIWDYRVLHDKSELLQSSIAEPQPPGDV
jgi:hypothetical protein